MIGQEKGAQEQNAQGFKSGLVSTLAFSLSVPSMGNESSHSSFPLLGSSQIESGPFTSPCSSCSGHSRGNGHTDGTPRAWQAPRRIAGGETRDVHSGFALVPCSARVRSQGKVVNS